MGLGWRGDFLCTSLGSMSGGGQYIGSDVGCGATVEPGTGNKDFPNKAARSNLGSTSG